MEEPVKKEEYIPIPAKEPLPTPYPGYSMMEDIKRDQQRNPPIGQRQSVNKVMPRVKFKRPKSHSITD